LPTVCSSVSARLGLSPRNTTTHRWFQPTLRALLLGHAGSSRVSLVWRAGACSVVGRGDLLHAAAAWFRAGPALPRGPRSWAAAFGHNADEKASTLDRQQAVTTPPAGTTWPHRSSSAGTRHGPGLSAVQTAAGGAGSGARLVAAEGPRLYHSPQPRALLREGRTR